MPDLMGLDGLPKNEGLSFESSFERTIREFDAFLDEKKGKKERPCAAEIVDFLEGRDMEKRSVSGMTFGRMAPRRYSVELAEGSAVIFVTGDAFDVQLENRNVIVMALRNSH